MNGLRIHKDFRPLVRELKDAGYTMRRGRKHFIVERDGKVVATIATTPGGWRSLANTRADLRRAGVIQ